MVKELKRVSTGIAGLDEMIEGGFPVPSFILITGEPGTGKTTFAVQSLFEGAKNGETCLYITVLSEPLWMAQQFLAQYKFYNPSLIDRKKIIFSDVSSALRKQPTYMLNILMREIEKYNPARIVIDPINVMKIITDDIRVYREFLHDFIMFAKNSDGLLIATYEMPYAKVIEEITSYMVDGLVVLSYSEEENIRKKYLEVLKMRGTKHLTGRHLLDISKDGLMVQPGLR